MRAGRLPASMASMKRFKKNMAMQMSGSTSQIYSVILGFFLLERSDPKGHGVICIL